METLIDLSDFGGMDAENVTGLKIADFNITRLDEFSVQLNSTTTTAGFLKYYVPGRLPIGARVTVIAETRKISGDDVQLRLDSFTDDDYTIGIGGGSKVNGTQSDEYVEVRATLLAKPDERYIRIGVGFHDSRIGVADVRNLRVIVEGADLVTTKPQHTTPAYMSRTWNIEELNREWGEVVSTGSIVRTGTEITFTGDGTSTFLVYGADSSTATRNPLALFDIDTSSGFTVEIQGTRTSGLPSVTVEYLDAGEVVVRSLRGYFLGNDGDYQTFYFPPLSAAKFARLSVGFFSITDGVFALTGLKVTQYGVKSSWGALSCVPIVATLTVDSGVWSIDNDSVGLTNRFASASIESVTTNALDIAFVFKDDSVRGMRPTVTASMDAANGAQDTYIASTTNIGNSGGDIILKLRSTGATIDPSTVSDGTRIQMIGFGIR